MKYDFEVTSNSSVYIITPLTDDAKEWWDASTDPDDLLPYGDGYAVEPRYVSALCEGILNDGLSITKNGKSMKVYKPGDLILVD